jgi:hypothetical protein
VNDGRLKARQSHSGRYSGEVMVLGTDRHSTKQTGAFDHSENWPWKELESRGRGNVRD